jgi:hypothetical protein
MEGEERLIRALGKLGVSERLMRKGGEAGWSRKRCSGVVIGSGVTA